MKGHFHNNGGRGRSYGLLLLVAFGFAILGVMVLHKLRERRIVTLLVKEKDHQLITLQLLLQKEREYVKEAKSKMESMKAKMRSLRNQKMELESRVLEMQSSIASLRDDQIAIEIALEEKRSELNQLTQTHQAILAQIPGQKEAEIQESKALNRSSNATQNLGFIIETPVGYKNDNISVLADDGVSNQPPNIDGDSEMVTGKEKTNLSGNEMKVKGSRNDKTDGMQEKQASEVENGEKENEERESKDQSGSEDDDYHGPNKVQYVGGKKLEIPKNLHGGGYTFRGKQGHISRLKGKRWRLTTKGKGISINSTLDTPQGLKMKTREQGKVDDTKVRDNKPDDDDRENIGDGSQDTTYLGGSMPEHAKQIMTKAGNAEGHQNVTYTSLENSNSSYEHSPRDMIREHRDRRTYSNSSIHSEDRVTKQGNGNIQVDEKDKKPDYPKMKDVNEAETEMDTQNESEEKGEE